MDDVIVRPASVADLPELATLSDHYVLNTTITFSTHPRTVDEWTGRITADDATGHHRVLVAERGGTVVGYAETGRFRPKPAYDRSIEVTAYVAPAAIGVGVGSVLYGELLGRLEIDHRFHRAYAVITLPNPVSVAFHERWGFTHRGTLTEVGYKFGRYLDIAFYQRNV